MHPYEYAQQLKPARDADLSNRQQDPLADQEEKFVGQLAVCNIGCVGRIEGREFTDYGKWAWVGTSLTGKPWSSTAPTLLQPEQRDKILELFEQEETAGMTGEQEEFPYTTDDLNPPLSEEGVWEFSAKLLDEQPVLEEVEEYDELMEALTREGVIEDGEVEIQGDRLFVYFTTEEQAHDFIDRLNQYLWWIAGDN